MESSENPQPLKLSRAISRRGFLAALGAAGALLTLAGCESSSTEGTSAGIQKVAPVAAGTPSMVPDIEPAPPRNFALQKPYVPPVDPKTINTADAAAGIIPRKVWALGGPNMRTIEPMDGIHLITFHHSGDPEPFYENDFWETAKHLEGVREYHRSLGWQDIGYHFAIDREGRVWQLRSLKYEGQHVKAWNGHIWNEHNIGVVVLGNFELQSPTAAQKERIKIFGKLLRKEYGLPVSKVFTHQELKPTKCPGRNMQPFMESIRARYLI